MDCTLVSYCQRQSGALNMSKTVISSYLVGAAKSVYSQYREQAVCAAGSDEFITSINNFNFLLWTSLCAVSCSCHSTRTVPPRTSSAPS